MLFRSNIRNNYGETALDLAFDNGKLEVANFLSGYEADAIAPDGVIKSSTPNLQPQNKSPNTVQLPRKRREAVGPSDNKQTSLFSASKNGQLDIVRSLLDRGSDVNQLHKTRGTTLHLASLKGDELAQAVGSATGTPQLRIVYCRYRK